MLFHMLDVMSSHHAHWLLAQLVLLVPAAEPQQTPCGLLRKSPVVDLFPVILGHVLSQKKTGEISLNSSQPTSKSCAPPAHHARF